MAAAPSRVNHALLSFKARAVFNFNRYVRKQIILQIGHGGLGDNLFLSHIPQIAKQSSDVHSVFISNKSVFRDAAYKSLIWTSNPYVDGFVDEQGIEIVGPHTRNVRGRSLDTFLLKAGFDNRISHVDPGCNLLDQYMLGLGLDDGLRFHEPKIYKRIPERHEYENAIIYDPNFITNAGEISSEAVREFFNREEVRPNFQMQQYANVIDLPEITDRISATSMEDFCSLIVSCKALYCLTTGTATLAAALGKPCTVLYGDGVNTIYHHSRMHRYVHV
ncbi:MAG TPA: hypothetical protein VFX07_00110 [Candidatus Udaeobacter sp.]|jgi:hypothetical protein|nr:hypothetical protein [Candidatus Udaeobacter sp.]